MTEGIKLTVLMPCLNEAETLATCIEKANDFFVRSKIPGEVLIADNGSTDGSQAIALELGARIVDVPNKGYGNALIAGIENSFGEFIIMGDADDSYNFSSLEAFVEKLEEGYELVIGNRFLGGIEPGAMPPLHRYLGNPVLSWMGRKFYKIDIGDFHCGLRGFRRASIQKIGLRSGGMEFASEMVVKSKLHELKICEVPTTLSPDGRSRPPHLRTWRDGFRHLRFLFLYSPRWLFFYPGLILAGISFLAGIVLEITTVHIGNVGFGVDSLAVVCSLFIVGIQAIFFSAFSKIYGIRMGLIPDNPTVRKFRFFMKPANLIAAGTGLLALSTAGLIAAFLYWGGKNFGNLNPVDALRFILPSSAFLVVGFQLFMSGLFMGVLEISGSERH